ncbi:Histone deacetylase 6 [Triplophysa tibetana]|uniref:Protein deacetylase HDAC6 n=1 Tax=Triplophysa tibetana TaxID=1572043 RepID=A0A5A9NX07_9TELE|nr:Histone deacetylase 6 [Triplophysa tibetana]
MDSVPENGSGDFKGSSGSPKGTQEMRRTRENSKPSHRNSLQEARRKGRMDQSKAEEEMRSRLQNLDVRGKTKATGTGLAYMDAFIRYHCLWDNSHPERPERVAVVMDTLDKEGLLARCVRVEAKAASEDELLLVHTKEYIELMRSTQNMTEEELKTLADKYDSVYLHPEIFPSACLAVGSVLQMVDKVMMSQLRNGFCVVRPPGHHAHVDQMNGYCMFNNLAIAARYAQKRHGVERVLIVDWDVHHGQGVQYIFEEDPSVLYFSVHRYEEGSFWPHLKESSSSSVGSGAGQGYNINIPWNKTGMEDGDYVAVFQQVLLPVAYEFQPQLVLVAGGFDSVIGDPKGEMRASPQCFSILTHMLKGIAQGRLVMALEGGYNLESTAEGVCASVRSLLGDPCPHLTSPGAPSESALKSISQTTSALYPFWKSLQTLEGGPLSDVTPLPAPVCTEVKISSSVTGLVYDQMMMLHHNIWDSHHPELPQRISRIFARHEESGLVSRCQRIPTRLATEEELALCHSSEHISTMKNTERMKPRDLNRLGNDYNSIFISNESYKCALMAAGACFNSVQAILTGQVRNGVAIVRPPGHHAEEDKACGFCFFNTAALTARYAQSITNQSLRVLILDWDVHHGNGTQHIFDEDDSVLYISLHRYEDATFFPSSEDANYDQVGRGKGKGYNVNIPWNAGKMGDAEYLAAFHHVVMPIAREFAPELVLVSAGFDAARGDPLGGYQVTPEGYAHFTHMLMSLAAGRVLVILEDFKEILTSCVFYRREDITSPPSLNPCPLCTSMLLGDSPPALSSLNPPHPSAAVTINNVLRAHAPYWRSLRIQLSDSLRLSLPSPKPKGKRTSVGKSKKSPRQSTPAQSHRQGPQHQASPKASAPPTAALERSGLDDLAQGMLALDLNTSASSNPSPTSVPIGGARRKVKPSAGQMSDSPQKLVSENTKDEIGTSGTTAMTTEGSTLKSETTVESGGAGDHKGACGYTEKSVFELVSGAQDVDGETMFVVDPLSWCPHLESVRPVPAGGVDVFLPCEDCGGDAENWICLFCYKVLCGRYVNQHMVTHGQVSGHPLVLSFADLSVWCYACESYVHNKALHEVKNSAHLLKFGEEMAPFN